MAAAAAVVVVSLDTSAGMMAMERGVWSLRVWRRGGLGNPGRIVRVPLPDVAVRRWTTLAVSAERVAAGTVVRREGAPGMGVDGGKVTGGSSGAGQGMSYGGWMSTTATLVASVMGSVIRAPTAVAVFEGETNHGAALRGVGGAGSATLAAGAAAAPAAPVETTEVAVAGATVVIGRDRIQQHHHRHHGHTCAIVTAFGAQKSPADTLEATTTSTPKKKASDGAANGPLLGRRVQNEGGLAAAALIVTGTTAAAALGVAVYPSRVR